MSRSCCAHQGRKTSGFNFQLGRRQGGVCSWPYACAAAIDIGDERILKELRDLGIEDAEKVSREAVSYGRATGHDRCSTCSMRTDEQSAMLAHCSLVNGLVRTDRICDKFDPADSTESVGGPRHIIISRHGATPLNNDDVSVDRIRSWKDIALSPDSR
jgi:hypothetical protein